MLIRCFTDDLEVFSDDSDEDLTDEEDLMKI